MLTYVLKDSNKTLTRQLYDSIKSDITKGILTPHTKLPSKHAFAKQLNVSNITVENAYLQLLSEGFIYSKPRLGYFVEELDLDYQIQEKVTHDFRLEDIHNDYRYDFSSNQTNPDDFPFTTWAKMSRRVLSDYQNELMKTSIAGGTKILREAISEHLYAFRHMNVSPDQIIIGSGTEYLHSLLIQLLGYEAKYGLETPGYNKISSIYNSQHITSVPISLDENGVRVDELDKKHVDILHVTPSHHFPTGITMPIQRRYELLKWANKGHYLIEDDFDSEFRMNGQPIESLYSLDTNERVIYMNTFTKSLTSTIRVSYMVLPPHLAKKFYESLSFYTCTVSTFEQYTLALFIKEGYFEKHINRMRNLYKKKRDALLTAIEESPLSRHMRIYESNAGLHFLITLDIRDDEIFLQEAHKNHVNIKTIKDYNSTLEHTFIINYSYLLLEDMKEAVKALYKSYEDSKS